jgi:serine/threonine-protein kinase
MIGNLIGSYKISAQIGAGGMGTVYRGVDLMLEREVAIKALRADLVNRPDLVERFRAEAVTLARLNHPNIATLYSFLRQGDDFFMVMEFVPGETLETVISRTGALPCAQAIRLMSQALEGIAHAHEAQVIHRDLKPANLMLTPQGVVKVMDFGIARALGAGRMTRAGRLVGTVEYMSPEQVRGQETDQRSDIYSLGIVLYELLTGRVPFACDSEYELMRAQLEDAPRTLAPGIPQGLEQIVLRALAKQPAARFQSADEFRAALLQFAAPKATRLPESAKQAPETRVFETAKFRPASRSLAVTQLIRNAQAALSACQLSVKQWTAVAASISMLLFCAMFLTIRGSSQLQSQIVAEAPQVAASPAPIVSPIPPTLAPALPASQRATTQAPTSDNEPDILIHTIPSPEVIAGRQTNKAGNSARRPARETNRENRNAATERERARRRAAAERALDQ